MGLINRTSYELTPARMGELANRLEESVEKLRSWGVRVIDPGRLMAAVRLLRKHRTLGTFPSDRAHLIEIAQAAREAQEFIEIADVVPDDRLKPLADSIQQAVQGSPGTTKSRAAQYQSELWVGAMLANSGLRTAVVTAAKGRRPDFVVVDGTQLYPVEVKRPAGSLRASKLIKEAVKQIDGTRYHGGVIAVDLSDCLPPNLTVAFGSGLPAANPAQNEVERLAGELSAEVFDEDAERIIPGRHSIFCIHAFARTMYWDETDLTTMYLKRLVLSVVYYHKAENNLRGHRARALAGALHKGIKAVGHQEESQLDMPEFPTKGHSV